MGKFLKPSDSEWYKPPSEHFSFWHDSQFHQVLTVEWLTKSVELSTAREATSCAAIW
jgi:hypothetical protein